MGDFKILLRGIRNNKTISILILTGLSLAFCVAIPLVCTITYHNSFDRFHPNRERIYNVYIDEIYHGTKDTYGELPLAFGKYIQESFPEVERMVRTKDASEVLISKDKTQTWKEDVLWVDPSFKDVFYLELLDGDKDSFLKSPNEAYISESLSKKIFENSNSVGKNIKINEKDYTISGIFKDYPQNSHLKFSILIPLVSRIPNESKYEWDSYEFLTYIKLKKGGDWKNLENKLQVFLSDYWIPWLKTNHNLVYEFNNENSIKLKLLPVSDIHLHGKFISSFEKESNTSTIYINLVIVLVLLLIAYFNLIGFTFSKGKRHQLQMTIKRCLGASKTKLISAFIIENLLYTIISLIVSLFIIFEIWSNKPPILAYLNTISLSKFILPVAILAIFAFVIALISGFITGTFFDRISLKTNSSKSLSYSRFWINRIMIISQMTSSIILLICIIGIYKQLKYISAYKIGIKTEKIVIINNGNKIHEHYNAFKNELKRSSLVKEVSCSNSYPFNWMSTDSYTRSNSQDQTPYPFQYFSVDTGFKKVFNFKLKEGRWFSDKYLDDKKAIILNEAAVKVMGLTNPIGEEFHETLSPSQKYHLIGVVNNFNFRSLHHSVEPLLITLLKDSDYWRFIEIKSTTADRSKLLAELKPIWDKLTGNEYLDYSFLDDKIAYLYEKEMNVKQSISMFCLIAILISCFGLLGIVFNTTIEKTKEIGIRKINGAKISEVMFLLNKDFVNWVVIAFIIACPVAWFAMHKWLQNFAFKTEISWWIFVLSGFLALCIALLTVSWQSWRAAKRNPVEALRYE
jgi:putative ABC transport system permease protein